MNNKNKMTPHLFTGFLAPWYLKSLKDTIINNNFPWHYKESIDEQFKYRCDKIDCICKKSIKF